MKIFYSLLFFFVVTFCFSQVTLVTWNLKQLGKSKTDEQITYIANVLNQYDIIAIQEVISGPAGSQAVAKIADALNRKGSKWEYLVSNPTQSTGRKSERYAFLWKTKSIKIKGKPFLETKYESKIEREPYIATFEYKNKDFSVASFHAVPKASKPETEIKYLKFFPENYPNLYFFVGDFNLSQSHNVFNPLKSLGFLPIFKNQKTTLKQECKEDTCLANPLDHIFYNGNKVEVLETGAILFYKDFENLKEAKKISDHIPIYIQFNLN